MAWPIASSGANAVAMQRDKNLWNRLGCEPITWSFAIFMCLFFALANHHSYQSILATELVLYSECHLKTKAFSVMSAVSALNSSLVAYAPESTLLPSRVDGEGSTAHQSRAFADIMSSLGRGSRRWLEVWRSKEESGEQKPSQSRRVVKRGDCEAEFSRQVGWEGRENGKNCVMDSSNSAQNTYKLQNTLKICFSNG